MTLFPGKGAKKVSVRMRKALWLAISLLVVVVLLVGGCAGHPKGMKSLRWLTDAEKERVTEIALNTPEAVEAREVYGVYTTSLSWVAISWLDHNAEFYGLDYEWVDEDAPPSSPGDPPPKVFLDMIPDSAEYYSRVEIYFGEPPQVLMRVAINPDTGKVAHVEKHGLKKLPTAP